MKRGPCRRQTGVYQVVLEFDIGPRQAVSRGHAWFNLLHIILLLFSKSVPTCSRCLGHNNVILSSNNTGSYKSSKLTPPAPESCFLLTYNQTLTQTNYTAVTIVLKTTTCCCFQSSRVDFYTAILLEAKVSKKSTHEVLRIQYCGFLRLSSRRSTSLPNICASFAAAERACVDRLLCIDVSCAQRAEHSSHPLFLPFPQALVLLHRQHARQHTLPCSALFDDPGHVYSR